MKKNGDIYVCVCIYIHTYIYIFLIHFAVHLKLTQLCLSQLYSNKNYFKNK